MSSLRCSAVCVCVSASSADTYSQCSPRGSVIRVNHLPSPVRRQKRRVFSNHAGQLVGKGAGELCGSKIPERKREKKKARKRDILKLYVYLSKFSLVLLELKNHRRPFHLSIHPPSAFSFLLSSSLTFHECIQEAQPCQQLEYCRHLSRRLHAPHHHLQPGSVGARVL